MKKSQYILMLLCLSLAFTSCGKDDNNVVVDQEWIDDNTAAFDAIKNNPAYTELPSLGNNGSIYYKVLKEGVGKVSPLYTSVVKCYYTGWLIDGTVFDQREAPYQTPLQTTVKGVIQGWTTALEYMQVGDRWEVWIPYPLAYGVNANGTIPGYSTLKFEVELAEIVEP